MFRVESGAQPDDLTRGEVQRGEDQRLPYGIVILGDVNSPFGQFGFDGGIFAADVFLDQGGSQFVDRFRRLRIEEQGIDKVQIS